MSMKTYPFVDTVFYIDTTACVLLNRRILLHYNLAPQYGLAEFTSLPEADFLQLAAGSELPDEFYCSSFLRDLAEQTSCFELCCCPSFEGEISTNSLFEASAKEPLSLSFDDDEICWLPLEQAPSLVCTAYPSADAIIQEIAGQLGDFLPADFDYAAHICDVNGTYFC